MKKVVIIEDEAIAAQRLSHLLGEVSPESTVEQVLQSVEETVEWFSAHPFPDLVFMDIHLADGNAFRIFDKVSFPCPIIFTTAYDQYALQAFKVNSIDYLLKPIGKEDLQRALDKWAILSGNGNDTTGNQQLDALVKMFSQQSQRYPSYFLIPVKDKLVPLAVNEIACFYLEDKVSRALTYPGKTVVIGKPLDVIAEQLDPGLFFRANRQFVVAHKAIEGITVWFGGKLRLTLSVPVPEDITISKSRVPEFREWYTYQ